MLHQVLVFLATALILSVAAWTFIYFKYGSTTDVWFGKARRILIPLITLLVCLIALLIIYSSDPGNTDDSMLLP